MLRWLVLIQAVIYLLVMPWLRSRAELGYNPPFFAAWVAVLALGAGGFLAVGSNHTRPAAKEVLRPRRWLWLAWVLLAILYAFVAVRFDLLNRRQGSEFMAELYATLPIWALGILRVYEQLLIPMLILYTFGSRGDHRWQRATVILVSIASLPFMGLADSRGRLLVLGLYLLCFVPLQQFLAYFYRNWRILVGATGAAAMFFVISAQRASEYGSFRDYLFVEVYSRLDGLNLVSQLRDAGLLSYTGSFDFGMFSPLIAKIPFLDAAQTAKLLGRTSSKQYIIQDLLHSTKFDDSNSMITDPLYFGGLILLFIAFFIFGRTMLRFDRYIADRRLLNSLLPTVLAMSFATSFAVFENDFFGSFANLAQVAILLLAFLLIATKKSGIHAQPIHVSTS